MYRTGNKYFSTDADYSFLICLSVHPILECYNTEDKKQRWSANAGTEICTVKAKRGKKTRRTKEEVGRQHQGMDRPGVRQVPEGSGEQGKMEKTGRKIICSAPSTHVVKGLMMMMMKSKSPKVHLLDFSNFD